MIFHATVRIAFETAAAFWRPWFREPEKKEVAAREHSKPASEKALQPTKREQKATEKKPERAQRPKPLSQEATMEKKPKAPIKRSFTEEQQLEREERIQKTERLRKLRLAKEAADREKNPSNNDCDEAQHAIKESKWT